LKEAGFANLVQFGSAREIAEALAAGQIDAWYATATEIVLQLEAMGRPGTASIGPAIQVVPVWLAGNKDAASTPIDAINAAIVRMELSGTIDRILRSYVPT
jgi:ABC-type amino acid transport substrate-binding protein